MLHYIVFAISLHENDLQVPPRWQSHSIGLSKFKYDVYKHPYTTNATITVSKEL